MQLALAPRAGWGWNVSKTDPAHAKSLMGSLLHNGSTKDHRDCLNVIARLTRERDEAESKASNMRIVLAGIVGLKRVQQIERLGYRAGKKGEAA